MRIAMKLAKSKPIYGRLSLVEYVDENEVGLFTGVNCISYIDSVVVIYVRVKLELLGQNKYEENIGSCAMEDNSS